MSAISIKVECSPGTEITNAFTESCRLASRTGVDVEFTFNEVTCYCQPGGDVKKGVEEYDAAISSKSQFKFAAARR